MEHVFGLFYELELRMKKFKLIKIAFKCQKWGILWRLKIWGPHHDVKLLDMMEMESLKMEIGNFKLIKIAFKCWEAAQNKQVRILVARAILKITKWPWRWVGPK